MYSSACNQSPIESVMKLADCRALFQQINDDLVRSHQSRIYFLLVLAVSAHGSDERPRSHKLLFQKRLLRGCTGSADVALSNGFTQVRDRVNGTPQLT